MKKILLKLLCGVLLVSMLVSGMLACSSSAWAGTTMTDWKGDVVSNGGFVAQTDNYVYYINGVATSTDDNTFGAPIKGTLMAADKTDLSKTEIVVPKLFAASDYNAGLFIDNGYVYYGTPSLDKASDGTVANSEMMFMRTSLDGKQTDEFFKVGALSTEYRFVKSGDKVFVVYYDAKDAALICYDTVAKSETVIAKTDDKTDKNYSLANYKFVTAENGEVAVLFTTTIYSEPYLKDKAEENGYSRGTEAYNNLFAYKPGDAVDETTGVAGTLIGSKTGYVYAITLAKEFVFYTETTVSATATSKTFGDSVSNLLANKKGVEIKNAEYATDANYIVSLDEVYSYADGKLYKATLIGDDKTSKTVVATASNLSKVLDIREGEGEKFVYYLTSENAVARKALGDPEAKEVIVSEGTVSSTWYAPEIIKVDGASTLFYVDSSSTGASYVKAMDVTKAITVEDTNDDGENDKFYLKDAVSMGIITEADKRLIASAKISEIANTLKDGVLPYEKVDGKLTVKAVVEARVAYDALSDEVKKNFDKAILNTLVKYEKAIEMENLYAKLDGMYGYENATDSEKDAIRSAYNEVKDKIEEFVKSEDYSSIVGYISNNAKWNYQQAASKFGVSNK